MLKERDLPPRILHQQGYSELKEREFSRQAKTKGVHHYQTGLTRNFQGSSLCRKEKDTIRNKKIQEGNISLVNGQKCNNHSDSTTLEKDNMKIRRQ